MINRKIDWLLNKSNNMNYTSYRRKLNTKSDTINQDIEYGIANQLHIEQT